MLSDFFFFFWLGSMWHPSPQTRDRTHITLVEGEVSITGRPGRSPLLLPFHTFVKRKDPCICVSHVGLGKSRPALRIAPNTVEHKVTSYLSHEMVQRFLNERWSQPLRWWQLFILPGGWSQLSYWFKDILIWTALQTLYVSNFDLTSGLCVLAAAFSWLFLMLFFSVCLRIVQHILKNHNLNLIDSSFSSVARIS